MVAKSKAGSAKRYGPRYGLRVRKQVSEVEKIEKQKHLCPNCKKHAIIRVCVGIYECKKCKTRFSGKAYFPSDKNVRIQVPLLQESN